MPDAATTGDAGEVVYDRAWEDSLILAFRDIQWQLSIEVYRGKAGNPSLATADIVEKLRPWPMLKLDGKAENLAADVITATDLRFFLFEFKRDEQAIADDAGKPVWDFLGELDNTSDSYSKFVNISRRCHQFVYGSKAKSPSHQGGVTGYALELLSTIYYDRAREYALDVQVREDKRKLADLMKDLDCAREKQMDSLELRHREEAVDKAKSHLNWTQSDAEQLKNDFKDTLGVNLPLHSKCALLASMSDKARGASFAEFCVYLKILGESVKSAETAPLKGAIVTSSGIFWPIGVLQEFIKLAAIFETKMPLHPGNAKTEFDELLNELAVLARKATSVQPSTSSSCS